MVKVKVTCNKNIIERFGVKKPEGMDFEYIDFPCSDERLAEQCKDADIIFCGPVDYFRRPVIEALDHCKLIHSLGVGFDKIDLEATKEKGIYVCNNRAVNAKPVAELAVAHMINALRRIPEADHKIKAGGVDGFQESFTDYQKKGQSELGTRTVGLVGFGAIGKEAAKILKAYGCTLKYYDAFRAPEEVEKEFDIEFSTYEDICKTCDIISYHVPVLDETRGMCCKKYIDMMKDGAVVVNVARGEIVNNEDLAAALDAGKVFAGLDVIAPEPPTADHPIFNLTEEGKNHLSITPHIAGTTDDAFIRMSEWSYADMVKVMNGERPNNVVNGL